MGPPEKSVEPPQEAAGPPEKRPTAWDVSKDRHEMLETNLNN